MNICRLLAVAAALCTTLGVTSGAEAAKRGKSKYIVVVSGCTKFVPPFCIALTAHGKTYVTASLTDPPIPRDTSVTVIGKENTGAMNPCFGTWLDVMSWKPNKKILCTQR